MQGLSSNFDQLKMLLSQLSDANIEIDSILLCETFLNDNNAHLSESPNYNFIDKNWTYKSKDGVAMCVHNNIKFNHHEDRDNFVE